MKIKIDLTAIDRTLLADREQHILDNFQIGMRAAALELRGHALGSYREVMKRINEQELRARIRGMDILRKIRQAELRRSNKSLREKGLL